MTKERSLRKNGQPPVAGPLAVFQAVGDEVIHTLNANFSRRFLRPPVLHGGETALSGQCNDRLQTGFSRRIL